MKTRKLVIPILLILTVLSLFPFNAIHLVFATAYGGCQTVGTTNIGSTYGFISYKYTTPNIVGHTINVASISIYAGGSGTHFKAALYEGDIATGSGTLVSGSSVGTVTTDGSLWYTITVTAVLQPNTLYQFIFVGDAANMFRRNSPAVCTSNQMAGSKAGDAGTYASFPDATQSGYGGYGNEDRTIYLTYEVSNILGCPVDSGVLSAIGQQYQYLAYQITVGSQPVYVQSITVFLAGGGNDHAKAAIYSGNIAGTLTLVAGTSTSEMNGAGAFVTSAVSGGTLNSGTSYWVIVVINGGNLLRRNTGAVCYATNSVAQLSGDAGTYSAFPQSTLSSFGGTGNEDRLWYVNYDTFLTLTTTLFSSSTVYTSTSTSITVSNVYFYTNTDSASTLFLVSIILIAIPTLTILIPRKNRSLGGVLMGLITGIIWAISATTLSPLALVLAIALTILAIFFSRRGGSSI